VHFSDLLLITGVKPRGADIFYISSATAHLLIMPRGQFRCCSRKCQS